MSSEQVYSLFGYRFLFRTDTPRAAELIAGLYGGHRREEGAPVEVAYEVLERGEGWSVGRPGETATQPIRSLPHALNLVETAICTDLSKSDNGRHFIHGAVVHGPRGDALISGVSGAGKSTLTLALAARGLRVAGDDMAVLDPSSGEVAAIPRPFHLDDRSHRLLRAEGLRFPEDIFSLDFMTPADFGVAAPPPARIRFVFMLEPERLESPRLMPRTQAEMTVDLLSETGRGYHSHLEGIQAVSRLVGNCRCYRVWSGELAATADALLGVLSARDSD